MGEEVALVERDVQHGDGAAWLGLFNGEDRWAGDCAVEEFPMCRDGVWLVSGGEVFFCYAEEDCGDVASVGDFPVLALEQDVT